jgi:5-formyltetrahydrofolate cyclo-ligase
MLGFDRQRHRLGYGGGYYDRTLAALGSDKPPRLAIGVAYACQEVAAVPVGRYDRSLDHVLTERFFL